MPARERHKHGRDHSQHRPARSHLVTMLPVLVATSPAVIDWPRATAASTDPWSGRALSGEWGELQADLFPVLVKAVLDLYTETFDHV
jgi:hypothetical protein